MLSLINAKSSQMTSIYADIVQITMPMVFPNIWRAQYVEYILSYLLVCQIAASGKREVRRLWHLHISNQIVR